MKKSVIFVTLLLVFCGSKPQTASVTKDPEPVLTNTPKRSVLIVIAHKDFRDEEFKEPYELLKNAGMNVTIASTDTTPANGMFGMNVKPEMLVESVSPNDFDALVLVGGSGCRSLWDNETLHGIIRQFDGDKKIIAAICIAPVILARAGILKEEKATVYPSVANEIKSLCAGYTGADVERSNNIITASGPAAAKDFARTILEAVSK